MMSKRCFVTYAPDVAAPSGLEGFLKQASLELKAETCLCIQSNLKGLWYKPT